MFSLTGWILVSLVSLSAYIEVGVLVVGQHDEIWAKETPNKIWPFVLIAKFFLYFAAEPDFSSTDVEKIEAAKERSAKVEKVSDIVDNKEWAEVGWPK